MDQRAMQIMALNGQIKRLSEENNDLRARLGGQELIGKFLVAALTGAAAQDLSNEFIVDKAFEIADLALKKMQGLGAKAPQKDPHTPDPQSPVSPSTV